ncbi:MAG: hypothetical protein R2695_03830 [Acidimicrobiales bacterium]
MIVAERPADAARFVVGMIDALEADPPRTGPTAPWSRGGLAHGDLVNIHGDYFGPVVNLAARLVDSAIPGEVPRRRRGRRSCRHRPRRSPDVEGVRHADPGPHTARGGRRANYQPSAEVLRVRERIDHPIIDTDGHVIEFTPWVRDLIVDIAGRGRRRSLRSDGPPAALTGQVPIELRGRPASPATPGGAAGATRSTERRPCSPTSCTGVSTRSASTSPCSTRPTG